MDDSGLRANADKIAGWHETLVESFIFAQPPGMGHEPAVLAYRDWMRDRSTNFMEEWRKILDSIPGQGAERLIALVDRVNRLTVAAQFLSDSTAASANARWARLDSVKTWLFDERRANPEGSRAAFISSRLKDIKARAREAGAPLTGDDTSVAATIAGWFRKANLR
jgi:hypothetical protein